MEFPKYLQRIVRCINADGRPEEIWDWPEENKLYQVEGFDRNSLMDGALSLHLKGLDPGDKYGGYRNDRFIEVAEIYLN